MSKCFLQILAYWCSANLISQKHRWVMSHLSTTFRGWEIQKFFVVTQKNRSISCLNAIIRARTLPFKTQQTMVWYSKHKNSASIESHKFAKILDLTPLDIMKFTTFMTSSITAFRAFGKHLDISTFQWIEQCATFILGVFREQKLRILFLLPCMDRAPFIQMLMQCFKSIPNCWDFESTKSKISFQVVSVNFTKSRTHSKNILVNTPFWILDL